MAPETNKQTLSDLVITPEQFCEDFHNGNERFERYCAVIDLIENSPTEVAKALGYTRQDPEYGLIRNEATKWHKNEGLPPSIQGLVRLHLLGVFSGKDGYQYLPYEDGGRTPIPPSLLENFDYNHPLFDTISLLASVQFWKGELQAQTNTTSKRARLNIKDINHPLFIYLNELGFSNPTGTNRLDLDGSVSRFISLFSDFVGVRNQSSFVIPNHVRMALNTLRTKDISESERTKAQEVIDDFIMLFLLMRGNKSESRNFSGSLPSKLTRAAATNLRQNFSAAHSMSRYSHHPFRTNKISANNNSHSHLVIFPKITAADIFEIQGHFHEKIEGLHSLE